VQISDRNFERMNAQYQLVTAEALADAKLQQERARLAVKPSLQGILLNQGWLKEDVLLQALAHDLGLPYVDVENASPEPATVLMVPEELALERGVLALELTPTQIVCAMQDPNDVVALDTILRRTKLTVVAQLASRGGILKKLAEYHDHYKVAVVENLMKVVRDQGKELTQHFGINVPEAIGGPLDIMMRWHIDRA
jgi:hypothetical protein